MPGVSRAFGNNCISIDYYGSPKKSLWAFFGPFCIWLLHQQTDIKTHKENQSDPLSTKSHVLCLYIISSNWLFFLCICALANYYIARQVFVRMSSSEVSVASRMGSNDLRLSLTLNPPPCPQNMAHIFTVALIHPNRLRFRVPCTWLSTQMKTKRKD